MVYFQGASLVDTNVILECWRIGAWRALSSGCRLETVEDCVIETQTGFQHRRAEQWIDVGTLRQSFAAIHHPEIRQIATLAIQVRDIALDQGERALWAHAITRDDDWILCGPDRASLRFGVRLGFRDRLVALETLLDKVGYPNSKRKLRTNYTASWLSRVLNEMVIWEMPKHL